MGTDRMNQAKDACKQIINSLPQGSGFNVVKFGSRFDRFSAENSVAYTNENKKAALEYIGRMSSDLGGTEILTAIKVAMCEDDECVSGLTEAKTESKDKISSYVKVDIEANSTIAMPYNDTFYMNNENKGWILKPRSGLALGTRMMAR